ncbi:hypothetical protein [Streptomyces sp. NPDC002785]|uniref:hypothetical protein n=1 Tax=Streptomyces sp. NPDC002785 TaxID=3154543 RepID=UPI0033259D5F
MARHALSKSRRRALLRAGLTVTAVGAALGAGGAAAQAAPLPHAPAAGLDHSLGGVGEVTGSAVTGALGHSLKDDIAPVARPRLDPLAGTGVNPLNNAVETQVADFKPISTADVTGPVTRGGAPKELPVVGQAAAALHG